MQVLDTLRKINVPIAKSFAVYRTDKRTFTQDEIEAQAINTKDRGEFYIMEAKKAQSKDSSNAMPIHRRHNSFNSAMSNKNGSDDKGNR